MFGLKSLSLLTQSLLFSGAVISTTSAADTPTSYGMLVFTAFESLDVFGPLDILNQLAYTEPITLSIIANTMDPVTTKPQAMNLPSDFGESIVPTHTFDDPPQDLEVLFVPGGVGTRSDEVVGPLVDYVKDVYPSLKYLVSVCTGATILAKSGVLDGRNATTNKKAWDWATSTGPNTCWDAQARWVTDGNIWTSSGVSAGIDTTYAWVSEIYGEDVANTIALDSEFRRVTDPSDDPFGPYWNATSKNC